MSSSDTYFSTIEAAIRDTQQGKPVIVVDETAEQGFLTVAAELVNPDNLNFMLEHAKGLICLAMTVEHAKKLSLEAMVDNADDHNDMAFTVSIDADPKFGVTTGISTFDRVKTIQVTIAHDTVPEDLRRPGHIFPVTAAAGGVLKRTGLTEASVDIAKISGLDSSAVLTAILNQDGEMAKLNELTSLAQEHEMQMIRIADLVSYRLQNERFVHREVEVSLPNKYSEDFMVYGYRDELSGKEHIALVKGDLKKAVSEDKPVMVRMHSSCITSDLFGSFRSDCGEQLRAALNHIVTDEVGVFTYLIDEGRGMGLINQLKAYKLQDEGMDTVEANHKLGFATDLRNFGVGAQILTDLGLKKIKLLTNNPKKIHALEGYGLEVTERVSIEMEAGDYNRDYLEAKKDKLGHMFKK